MKPTNLNKTRGIIDPFTLGFILSLIGVTSTYIAHGDDNDLTTNLYEDTQSNEMVAVLPDNGIVFE